MEPKPLLPQVSHINAFKVNHPSPMVMIERVLSHLSCNLARPIFSSMDGCGQTIPVSYQT